MRTILSLLIVLFSAFHALHAQDSTTFNKEVSTRPSFALGIQAGASTGTGIAFRYITNQRWAAEIIASYISLSKPFWSLGGEIHFDLERGESSRVYALGGVGYYYAENDSGDNGLTDAMRLGLGVGYDWFLSSKVALGFELPITGFIGNGSFQVLPLPQIQFMFHFN